MREQGENRRIKFKDVSTSIENNDFSQRLGISVLSVDVS